MMNEENQNEVPQIDEDAYWEQMQEAKDVLADTQGDCDVAIWEFFLSEASSDDLYNLGVIFSQLPQQKRSRIVALLLPYTQRDDWNVRDSAVRILGAMKDTEALPVIAPLLLDEDGLVRYSSLRAFRLIGAVMDKEVLVSMLNDSAFMVKGEAATYLIEQGMLPSVLDHVKSSGPWDILSITEVLVKYKIYDTLKDVEKLADHEDAEIRLWVVEIMRKSHLRAYRELVSRMKKDINPKVRIEARKAVREMIDE
jgi:HEAT repeat protein